MMNKILFVALLCLTQKAFCHVGRNDLSDERHFDAQGHHNPKYDHDAFLGKELADELEKHSSDENKKTLIKIFAKVDVDGNGTISQPEMYQWIKKVAADSLNKDARARWEEVNPEKLSKLTWEQYLEAAYGKEETFKNEKAYYEQYLEFKKYDGRRWKAADKNKDNTLDFEEFKAMVHPEDYDHMKDIVIDETLDSIDKDKDGKISVDEFLADLAITVKENFDPSAPKSDWALKHAAEFDEYRDKNHDGFLNREEILKWVVPVNYDPFEAESKHLFYHSDANKDNQLSLKEILDNQEVFVGSQATQYGQMKHSEL